MLGFNRTFMELKSTQFDFTDEKVYVLIVPLWNWNSIESEFKLPEAGFNRTFMELKFIRKQAQNLRTLCFNRTFMELK